MTSSVLCLPISPGPDAGGTRNILRLRTRSSSSQPIGVRGDVPAQTQGLQGSRNRVLTAAAGWPRGFHPQGQSIYKDVSDRPETSGPTVWTRRSGSEAVEHLFPLSLTTRNLSSARQIGFGNRCCNKEGRPASSCNWTNSPRRIATLMTVMFFLLDTEPEMTVR